MLRNCIILITLSTFFLQMLTSQSSFIRKHEIIGYNNAYFTSIKATDTCFWVFGTIWDTTAPYYGGTSLFKFDLFGNLTKQKDLISKTQFYGFNNDMYAFNNKLYTSTLVPYSSSSLIAYNIAADSFEIITTVNNLLPEGDFFSINNLHFDASGNSYMAFSVSSNASTNSFTQIQLLKFNRNFNLEWYKIIGNSNIDEIPYAITTDSQGNVFIGAVRLKLKYIEGDNNYSRSIVYKLTREGKLENEAIADSLSGAVYDLLLDQYGKYICASEVLFPYDPVRPFPFPAIQKTDTDGKIVFRQHFQEVPNKEKVYSHFNKVLKVNLNYIALGGLGVYDNDLYPDVAESRAIMIKFNEYGELIWKRIYKTGVGVEGTRLYDFDKTSDNGFILAGLGSLGTDTGIDWKAMLLKVDSFGCLVPGCNLTDNINFGSVEDDFKIYPNPASDYIAIYNTVGFKIDYRLVDLSGRELLRQFILPKETAIVDLSKQPAGIYFIQTELKGKPIVSKMFLKE